MLLIPDHKLESTYLSLSFKAIYGLCKAIISSNINSIISRRVKLLKTSAYQKAFYQRTFVPKRKKASELDSESLVKRIKLECLAYTMLIARNSYLIEQIADNNNRSSISSEDEQSESMLSANIQSLTHEVYIVTSLDGFFLSRYEIHS